MNTNRQTAINENQNERRMQITSSNLMRWAGLAAVLAGLSYIVVGLFHPLNVLASVTTSRWAIVHIFALAMCFFGLPGLTGLYARQAKATGWLGLAGFGLLSLWLLLILGFTFVEVFILPWLATTAPAFVEAFLGVFTGAASTMDLGALPMVWLVTAPLYILGGLLFGIATFRAGILPRGAGALLAVGTVLGIVLGALLPPELQPKVTVPVGLALVWLGYSLWSERRETASEMPAARVMPQLSQTGAK